MEETGRENEGKIGAAEKLPAGQYVLQSKIRMDDEDLELSSFEFKVSRGPTGAGWGSGANQAICVVGVRQRYFGVNFPTPIGLLHDQGVIGQILRQLPRTILDEAEAQKIRGLGLPSGLNPVRLNTGALAQWKCAMRNVQRWK